MKIQNVLDLNIPDRSQRYFAHVTTVTLSCRVQHIVVIGRVCFTLECFEFSSNFEFDRNMLSGTGARSTWWFASIWHHTKTRPSITTHITKFMGPTWGPLGPVGPRWSPCWPHEPCLRGTMVTQPAMTCAQRTPYNLCLAPQTLKKQWERNVKLLADSF